MAAATEPKSIASILDLLESRKRLDRENGISKLQQLYDCHAVNSELEETLVTTLKDRISGVHADNGDRWEKRHGAIMAVIVMVQVKTISSPFTEFVLRLIPDLLEDTESRIRIETGVLIGKLCSCYGVSVFVELQDCIYGGIRATIDRDLSTVGPELVEKLARQDSKEEEEVERPSSPTAAQIFHDTAGWKTLETYMNSLHHAVDGCGSSFEPHITSDLFELLFSALKHTNRFVREMGYKVIASIAKCPGLSKETIDKYWKLVAHQLAQGLADNWSQVRMSASVATREFLTHLKSTDTLQQYLPVLLPPMCLNRYYIAEGVQLYSQETWRQVTEGRGIQLVEQNIQEVVTFYTQESSAANHAVREAACACIAELGSKVSPEYVQPHISSLVNTLLDCFKDDSWPVRDCKERGWFFMNADTAKT